MGLASTLKNWLGSLGRLFAGTAEPPAVGHTEPVAGHAEPETGALANLDLGQAKISLDDAKRWMQHAPPDDTGYWWHCPPQPPVEIAEFEAVDCDDLRAALTRKLQEGTFSLIEVPANIMSIVQILNNKDFVYGDVANLMSRSPAIAGEFLKVANSAVYSRGIPVQDLRLALTRLGSGQIKAMLYLCSAKVTFASHPLFNQVASSIIRHCQAAGQISSYLSERYFPDQELAFLAGFMHDIGKLGILHELSEGFDLPKQLPQDLTEEAFTEIFTGLHEQVGVMLAKNWQLAPQVCEAILHHHDFAESEAALSCDVAVALTALTNLSDTMARMLGHGRPISGVDLWSLPACDRLNVMRDDSSIAFFNAIPTLLKQSAQSAG